MSALGKYGAPCGTRGIGGIREDMGAKAGEVSLSHLGWFLFAMGLGMVCLLAGGCASSSYEIMDRRGEPVALEAVRVLAEVPAESRKIARVAAVSGGCLTEGMSVERAVEALRRRAAELGANGLVVTQVVTGLATAYSESRSVEGEPMYTGGCTYEARVWGLAIRVPDLP